jgi:hypothetical protein
MQAINWLHLQPLPTDLEALHESLHEVMPLRKVCQLLVETTLRAYPWAERVDLISCYHPSQIYKQGQRIALFISDTQNARPAIWLVTQVRQVKAAENPVQGQFQVLTLDFQGKQIQMAAGIPNASYLEPDVSHVSHYTSKELAWLVEWVSKTYVASLQTTVKKLIQTGQIGGTLAGEIFVPERTSGLSPELLQPVFEGLSPARPWINLDEIAKDLPDLSSLQRETVLGFLPSALKEGSYRSLGGGRWTTIDLFHQIDRNVPQSVTTWTKQDRKDLAGYDKKFMPTEGWRALEGLGIVERLPKSNESRWRPPKGPIRFPALNSLHLTQTYFPVGSLLPAFAPDIQLVFVQWINGEHQPFLLDRENCLLKAVQPEELRARILKESLPAGTSLWLEYEGQEQYRIAPRLLPFKRMVPCKLAHLKDGRLQIEHTQISMMYEGEASLFRADLRSEHIEALFAEAVSVGLSLREAVIYAIQELCRTDPDRRAHWSDIFNAVFLQRLCSPRAVSLLLYTQPCFEQIGDGYFRYKPALNSPLKKPRKRKDRLAKLWDTLLSNPLLPDPVAEVSSEDHYPIFPTSTSDLKHSSLWQGRETEPEFSMLALPLVAVETDTVTQAELKEKARLEMLPLRNDEPDPLTPADTAEPLRHDWQDSFDRLLQSVEELVNGEPATLPAEEEASEAEAVFDTSIETAHEEALSLSSPFRWEPKPSWIDVRKQPAPPLPSPAAPRPRVYTAKIPSRPLHKQPLYRRLFFYLRGWISRISRKSV